MRIDDGSLTLTAACFFVVFVARTAETACAGEQKPDDTSLQCKSPTAWCWPRWLLILGTVAALVGAGWRWHVGGHPPLTNMFESLITIVCLLGISVLLFTARYPVPLLEGLAALLGVLALGVSTLFSSDVRPPVPALQSGWLYLHVVLAFVGEVCFAIGFILACLFGWRQVHESAGTADRGWAARLPTARVLDDYVYRAIALGYPLYTVGALIFGAIWAQKAWGRYWSWDPKETWALVTFLVYSVYLHLRLSQGRTGVLPNLVAGLGFLVTLFTLFGVNFLMGGLHSYASQ